MERDSSDSRQRILLITGMSGAGKTTALRVLEDLGWEAIDNFPVRLLDRLIREEGSPASDGIRAPLAIGFDTRTRGFDPEGIIALVKDLTRRDDLVISTLFLDCSGQELERRYNENRRRHPLADGKPVAVGITAERELLAQLRHWADAVINTTDFSSHDLQQAIRGQFADDAAREMTVTVSSFGFARGMPPMADLLFDMRFLDNPHWQPDLRPLTGKDAPVGEHIMRDPAYAESFERIRDLLLLLLPRYEKQGKSYVNIAFGCTGGRHRSVHVAARVAQTLRESGYEPVLTHRNLDSAPQDGLEGRPPPASPAAGGNR